jgi:hypothetical protein
MFGYNSHFFTMSPHHDLQGFRKVPGIMTLDGDDDNAVRQKLGSECLLTQRHVQEWNPQLLYCREALKMINGTSVT